MALAITLPALPTFAFTLPKTEEPSNHLGRIGRFLADRPRPAQMTCDQYPTTNKTVESVARGAGTPKCAAKGDVLTHLSTTTIVAAATTPARKEAHMIRMSDNDRFKTFAFGKNNNKILHKKESIITPEERIRAVKLCIAKIRAKSPDDRNDCNRILR
ncbi:hypothetical protein CRYUN_Cryun34aG0009500 [Craigia yunnanensis]